ANDLQIGASPTQTELPAILNATKYINAPACPNYPPCSDTTASGGGQGGMTGAGGAQSGAGGTGGVSPGGGRTVGGEGERPITLGAVALGLWLAMGRRRRRAR